MTRERLAFAWFAAAPDGTPDLARPRFYASGGAVRTVVLARADGAGVDAARLRVWAMPVGVYEALVVLHRDHGLAGSDVLLSETSRGVQVVLAPGQTMVAIRERAVSRDLQALDLEVAELARTITTDPAPAARPRPGRAARAGRGRSSRAA